MLSTDTEGPQRHLLSAGVPTDGYTHCEEPRRQCLLKYSSFALTATSCSSVYTLWGTPYMYIAGNSGLVLGPAVIVFTFGPGAPGTEPLPSVRLGLSEGGGCLCPQTGSSPGTGSAWGVSRADIHLRPRSTSCQDRISTRHLSNAFCEQGLVHTLSLIGMKMSR